MARYAIDLYRHAPVVGNYMDQVASMSQTGKTHRSLPPLSKYGIPATEAPLALALPGAQKTQETVCALALPTSCALALPSVAPDAQVSPLAILNAVRFHPRKAAVDPAALEKLINSVQKDKLERLKPELDSLVEYSLRDLPYSARNQFKPKLKERMYACAGNAIKKADKKLQNDQSLIIAKQAAVNRFSQEVALEGGAGYSIVVTKNNSELSQSKAGQLKDMKDTLADLERELDTWVSTTSQIIMIDAITEFVSAKDVYEIPDIKTIVDYNDDQLARIVASVDQRKSVAMLDRQLIPLHKTLVKEASNPKTDRGIFIEKAHKYTALLEKKPSRSLVSSFAAETASVQKTYMAFCRQLVLELPPSYEATRKRFEEAKKEMDKADKVGASIFNPTTKEAKKELDKADKVGICIFTPTTIERTSKQVTTVTKLADLKSAGELEKLIDKLEAHRGEFGDPELKKRQIASFHKELELVKAWTAFGDAKSPGEKEKNQAALKDAYRAYLDDKALKVTVDSARELLTKIAQLETLFGYMPFKFLKKKNAYIKATPAEYLSQVSQLKVQILKNKNFKAYKHGQ